MKTLEVLFGDVVAGYLSCLSETSYSFSYAESYLSNPSARPISVNLPLTATPYDSPTLHPIFDNLISEGWLLESLVSTLKIDPKNRFELIAHCGLECVGAVSLRGTKDD